MALIQQGVGNIPQRFWSILIQHNHTVFAALLAAYPWCQSPVGPHPSGALIELRSGDCWGHWVKLLSWFEICDTVFSCIQENVPHTITPPAAASTVDTRQDGSMFSRCLCQFLILPSKCCRRNRLLRALDIFSLSDHSFVNHRNGSFWWAHVAPTTFQHSVS